MTQEFKKAVEDKNLAAVRMMLSNELLFDPSAKSFAEMLEFAKDKLPNLFEAEAPSRFEIPSNKEEWNDEVLSQMKRDLNMNFSVEKLAIFVEMAKHLGAGKKVSYPDPEPGPQPKPKKTGNNAGKIVTGSGAVIALTGLCIEGTIGTVLSILGGVVVIGGVILLSVTNQTK